jgi:hypothetical protein
MMTAGVRQLEERELGSSPAEIDMVFLVCHWRIRRSGREVPFNALA